LPYRALSSRVSFLGCKMMEGLILIGVFWKGTTLTCYITFFKGGPANPTLQQKRASLVQNLVEDGVRSF
jgi:hypothetical protein